MTDYNQSSGTSLVGRKGRHCTALKTRFSQCWVNARTLSVILKKLAQHWLNVSCLRVVSANIRYWTNAGFSPGAKAKLNSSIYAANNEQVVYYKIYNLLKFIKQFYITVYEKMKRYIYDFSGLDADYNYITGMYLRCALSSIYNLVFLSHGL